jgi:hypothetical protein
MVRRGALTLALAAVLVTGCNQGDSYEVEYTNVEPRLEADAVVAIVRDNLEETAKAEHAPEVAIDIVRVRAMPMEDMPAAVPGIEAIGGNPPPSGVVWVVEANGPFLSVKGPPAGASGPPFRTATHGWFVVDDASGEIIALEMAPSGLQSSTD